MQIDDALFLEDRTSETGRAVAALERRRIETLDMDDDYSTSDEDEEGEDDEDDDDDDGEGHVMIDDDDEMEDDGDDDERGSYRLAVGLMEFRFLVILCGCYSPYVMASLQLS